MSISTWLDLPQEQPAKVTPLARPVQGVAIEAYVREMAAGLGARAMFQ
jgi:hypothetical protein